MAGPAKRYFTVEEAEWLIPRLESAMSRLMACHAAAGRARSGLQEAQRAIMLAGGSRLDHEFWRVTKGRLAAASTELQAKVAEILNLGGVPKDLEMGLVDFPARLGEREVNLCWRYGERQIRFWHGLDEGYAGRKPWPGGA